MARPIILKGAILMARPIILKGAILMARPIALQGRRSNGALTSGRRRAA